MSHAAPRRPARRSRTRSWPSSVATGSRIPRVNARVAGYEVDALWRGRGTIVELEDRAFHDHEDAFERDREKAAALATAG